LTTQTIRPIRSEDISPADFDKYLKMLRWLAREHPREIRFRVFPTIETYYKHHGGPRLREGGGQ
jgi:hypothetical protein